MVKNYGLTHIALAVRDIEQSLRFYQQVFGVEAYFRDEGRVHLRSPGRHDVITLDENMPNPGMSGGVMHFGFRLETPEDIDDAVRDAIESGGSLQSRGEFSPGYPYAFVTDPDGYQVEIWYE